MLKGDPPAFGPKEKGEPAGCGAASACMVKGLGGGVSCLIPKGLAASVSEAGLMENGEGAGAGSGAAKPGDAAAKGLIGNACACVAPGSAWGAIWKGDAAGAGGDAG